MCGSIDIPMKGVPFKYEKRSNTHTKFAQDVKFSPNGDLFVSVGSDSKIFLYDGKSGDLLGECSSTGAHKGSIVSSPLNIFLFPELTLTVQDGMLVELRQQDYFHLIHGRHR